MARRSAAQIRAQIRQAQAKQRQAVSKYNAAVRRYNADARQRQKRRQLAVNQYNAAVRRYNAHVRDNRARIKRELDRLASQSRQRTTRTVTYRTSVDTLVRSFTQLDAAHQSGAVIVDDELLGMSGNETANSIAVLNAMLEQRTPVDPDSDEVEELRATTIADELRAIDDDLAARWEGAVFALHPKNPDAGRHFCTSAREMLSTMLELLAPDDEVLAADPDSPLTPDGTVSRRARIRHCLARQRQTSTELETFIELDLENVLALFDEFNSATHGAAGRFDLHELRAIKVRVEDAVRYVCRIAAA